MRSSVVIAGAAAAVAAVLLVGGWLLLGGRGPAGSASSPGVAPTTMLSWPPDPSDGSRPPDPYPTVPSERVRAEHNAWEMVRTSAGGRRLLIEVRDSDCSSQQVRLLGEHADRVEVEIRTIAKPPPPGVSIAPDGSYGCVSFGGGNAPHAVIDLDAPLGERAVVIHSDF